MTTERMGAVRSCEWCSGPIPAGKRRHTRYCSLNCVKRASEDRHRKACPECGERMAMGSAWKVSPPRPNELCDACYRKRGAAVRRARLEDVAEMYCAGRSIPEIAEMLGYGPNSNPPEVAEARRLGLIGYRNRGYAA